MEPPILLLPLELKHHIAALSSPKSLAALARTHTAYRDVAEQALYHTLSILCSNDDLKCMEILATKPKKAALVRFLTIDKNKRAMIYLFEGLINMRSLSDFRIRMHPGEIKSSMIEDLNNILCEGHFRLETLYCNDFLDISQIIKSQTELQIFGLYTQLTHRMPLKTLKTLHNAQFFLPIIFTLERESFISPVFNHISIFPAFCSADRCATISQMLLQSLGKDRCSSVNANEIHDLSIYLIDSSDMPSIRALVKDMTMIFPHINWIYFWFEARFTIPPQEKKELLSLFPEGNIATRVKKWETNDLHRRSLFQ